jgi:hypothetical protein
VKPDIRFDGVGDLGCGMAAPVRQLPLSSIARGARRTQRSGPAEERRCRLPATSTVRCWSTRASALMPLAKGRVAIPDSDE